MPYITVTNSRVLFASAMPENRVDPGLALKITPPRARRVTAPKAWLARNCALLRERGVGLVNAPGGFGKTTLLTEWRRELLAQGSDVGWLLLDRRDTGGRFIAGLVACLRAATGNPRFAALASQAAAEPNGEIEALTASARRHRRARAPGRAPARRRA